MKQFLILTLIFIGFTTFSQTKSEQIDEQVKTYNTFLTKYIDEEMEEYVPTLTTTCPMILPAIGLVDHNITIYFDHVSEEMELNGQEMRQFDIIRKVTFQLKSGSYYFDYTYHFNEIGMLIYQSEYMEDASLGCTLSAYYFDKEQCIKTRTELIATDFCEVPSENQPEERTEFTTADNIRIKWIMESAAKYKRLLALYTDLIME